MKWLVGYQLLENDSFLTELLRQKTSISEVYFSYGTMPNGRHSAVTHETLTEWEAARRMDEDLHTLSTAGFSFNLLLNGNCYGGRSLARGFLLSVCECVEEVGSRFGLSSVTTTSPVLADLIKKNFPDLAVRASVNLEIGTVSGMEYLADRFDGFYIAKELNRDISALHKISSWCKENGKKCYLLANSGCLSHCSARQFHDNLVAHEKEIAEMDNGAEFHGICENYLRTTDDPSRYLRNLNFIRPEDIALYEDLVDGIKLATRVGRNPAQVLRAYQNRAYTGNLLELLEPDHARHLYPKVLENSRLPEDFGRVVSSCKQHCSETACNYCRQAVEQALVTLPDAALLQNNTI